MATPREEATAELLYFIDQFMPGSPNREIYEKRLKAMSNREFEEFITRLETGEEVLALFTPNFSEHRIEIERNFEIARQLDYPLYQHLYLTDPQTGKVSRTSVPHLVIDLPIRRQVQMLTKKISIPENNRVVDERTGQATGESKGASMSYPEIQINAAKGLDNMVLELIKARGGQAKLFHAMNQQIEETGSVDVSALAAQLPGTVKAAETLSVYLKAMHLDNNL